jgi:membrane associated rhomboid family serine protease
MIPLRDDNPTLQTSVATFAVIGLNLAAWVFVQGLGSEPALTRSVCQLGAIPGELLGRLPAGTQVPLGPRAACVLSGEPNWITVVTSMFMHGGWFHIIGNMWFLYVFGDNVEDSMGSLRFTVFYLLCGLAAVAAQILSNPTSGLPMVGASGAIGGVMGAYAVLYPRAPVEMLIILGFYIDRIVVPAVLMLGYWFLLQLLGGLPSLGGEGGGVAFFAHIGGFLAGVLLIFVFRSPKRLAAHRRAFGSQRQLWSRARRRL